MSPRELVTISSDCNDEPKSISFSSVHIRLYTVALGQAVVPESGGVPIGITGNHHSEESIDLDKFEGRRKKKKTGKELYLSQKFRMDLLLSKGVSVRQISKKIQECDQIRMNRVSLSLKVDRDNDDDDDDDIDEKDDNKTYNSSNKFVGSPSRVSKFGRKLKQIIVRRSSSSPRGMAATSA